MKEELKAVNGCVCGEVYELNQSSDENGNTVEIGRASCRERV